MRMVKNVAILVGAILMGVAAHAAVVLPAADGWTLDAGDVGLFFVKAGPGPGVALLLKTPADESAFVDNSLDVNKVRCDMQILSWDDMNRELFYWKSDGEGYSIWVWRPGGEPQLIAWSYTQPAGTMEGLGGGLRPLNTWNPEE
jgi:hypothetical protein